MDILYEKHISCQKPHHAVVTDAFCIGVVYLLCFELIDTVTSKNRFFC